MTPLTTILKSLADRTFDETKIINLLMASGFAITEKRALAIARFQFSADQKLIVKLISALQLVLSEVGYVNQPLRQLFEKRILEILTEGKEE